MFSAWVARIDDGAAGEAHARGEADGDVGYDSFHHPGTLCYADDGVVEFSTTRGPTATSSVVVGFGRFMRFMRFMRLLAPNARAATGN